MTYKANINLNGAGSYGLFNIIIILIVNGASKVHIIAQIMVVRNLILFIMYQVLYYIILYYYLFKK